MTMTTDEVLEHLAADVTFSTAERDEMKAVIATMATLLQDWGYGLDDERHLALASHTLAFVRRVRDAEALPGIDADVIAEADPTVMTAVREALEAFSRERGAELSDAEIFLFATHVEVARAVAAPTT